MSGLIRTLENVYAAAAFGECGEWKSARAILKGESPAKGKTKKIAVRPRSRVGR